MGIGGPCLSAASCVIGLFLAAVAHAQPPVGCDPQQRAGYPLVVSPWARPSDTGAYVGYLVGGGAARCHKAEPAHPGDGTWGWDYAGRWLPRRVMLLWWHGRHYQGGIGSYRTDGPHVLHPLTGADH
jgi:hypothetical protein